MRASSARRTADHIELMTRGSFTKKNGSYYISYKETQTIGFEGCTTTIKIAEDGSRVALLRFGRANSQLLIERDRRNLCHYETEVGLPHSGRHRRRHRLQADREGRQRGRSATCWMPTTPASSAATRWNDGTARQLTLIVFRLRLLRQAGFALKHERTLEMTDFEKTYQNYNPRQTALDEARALLTAAARAAMADGTLPEAELPAFIVEIPADVKNGDIASNIAMAGARTWRKAPKMIADALIAHLPALDGGVFAKVKVAGPGFINLFLAPSFWAGVVLGACSNKEYGRTDHGKGAKYNVEFVSANPTGPMHMGNARGGALGDCLAAVLDWSGYDVTREFYINDAGNQIQKFGKSLAVRYLQKYCGEEAYPLPAECYQGGDIKVLAGEFAELNGDKYVASCKGMDEETLFESEAFAALKDALVAYALPKNIAALKRDLGKYRIDYDVWFHESTLHESGAVLAVVDKLLELGACYKAEDGAIMYRSAQYAAKYGTVNKKKTDDGTEEEAKDEVLVPCQRHPHLLCRRHRLPLQQAGHPRLRQGHRRLGR